MCACIDCAKKLHECPVSNGTDTMNIQKYLERSNFVDMPELYSARRPYISSIIINFCYLQNVSVLSFVDYVCCKNFIFFLYMSMINEK